MALVSVRLAEAQQPGKVPRIGYLAQVAILPRPETKHSGKGLRDLGYMEGKNILVEYRYAEGKLDRLSELAAELVRSRSTLLSYSRHHGRAAKQATNDDPDCHGDYTDPVATGVVDSLALPGGNITGLTRITES